jgi:hypothetical protein
MQTLLLTPPPSRSLMVGPARVGQQRVKSLRFGIQFG